MPGDKRKKKVRGAAVIRKAKNIVINIKTGAKRSGAKRNAAPATAPQLARTAINIAVSQQQQQRPRWPGDVSYRARTDCRNSPAPVVRRKRRGEV